MSTLVHSLLLSAENFKLTMPVSQSCENTLISPIILQAQDKFIQPVLGTDLFEKLKTDIQGNSLSGDYLTLVRDYILKCLCQYSYAMLLPQLRVRSVRHSVVQMDNEQGASVSYDDIKPLISTAENMGEFYRERLIDYLQHNSSLFPEYKTNNEDQMSATTRNYYSGINMDKNYSDMNIMKKAVLSAMGYKDVC